VNTDRKAYAVALHHGGNLGACNEFGLGSGECKGAGEEAKEEGRLEKHDCGLRGLNLLPMSWVVVVNVL
jgi:hypothetical protein